MKKVFILGSTGSIGVNTLNVLSKLKNDFRVTGLTVNSNIESLRGQVLEFEPEVVVIGDQNKFVEFKNSYKGKAELLSGEKGILEAAKNSDYDILVSSLVGFAGLAPTIEGIKRGKRIALANKETLVVAGEIINKLLKSHNSEIIPVDSEHSAIFQCLTGEKPSSILKLILTASGGPFHKKPLNEFKNITVADALAHPNWEMGSKITIDSATMMNKGLEVIEAHWLFNLDKSKIEVVIHPQSIIHSMVEFIDGSIKAQLGLPDMKLPIQYALTYPERFNLRFLSTDLRKIKELTFFEPDFNKFECLKLAYDVMEHGGTAPCVLNAANEIAVSKFLNGRIGFPDIPVIIKKSLDEVDNHNMPDLETIFDCDRRTREFAQNL